MLTVIKASKNGRGETTFHIGCNVQGLSKTTEHQSEKLISFKTQVWYPQGTNKQDDNSEKQRVLIEESNLEKPMEKILETVLRSDVRRRNGCNKVLFKQNPTKQNVVSKHSALCSLHQFTWINLLTSIAKMLHASTSLNSTELVKIFNLALHNNPTDLPYDN